MQNIQDLKDKIFSESRYIIDILGRINNVDELISRQDLLNDLAEKISFLKLLDKNLKGFETENSDFSDNELLSDDLVTEEEAIFNNEFTEIGDDFPENEAQKEVEEEAIFNNQLNEIIENEYHENIVTFVEENQIEEPSEYILDEHEEKLEEEADFNNQLNEIDEEKEKENADSVLSFVDEERILDNSEPENDDDFDEIIYNQEETHEETLFSDQLNEITEEKSTNSGENHIIPDIFEEEQNEDEILIEETEAEYSQNNFQDELITENSNVETILNEIKKDSDPEIKNEDEIKTEDSERRKILDIEKPQSDSAKETQPSDESFENLEAYREEKKIKLAHIRGLKSIQTLFDDDPLEREIPKDKVEIPVLKEDTGSLIKTNIPTDFMEAEKPRPEFRLDLNDRLAFTKVLFNGSQTDLNNAISDLNRCKNLEEAKEYLSDLYYDKKWDKVDEYAQRLWILVENKFM